MQILTTAGSDPMASSAKDYTWDDGPQPQQDTLNLWIEVGNGLDKNQTGKFLGFGILTVTIENSLLSVSHCVSDSEANTTTVI